MSWSLGYQHGFGTQPAKRFGCCEDQQWMRVDCIAGNVIDYVGLEEHRLASDNNRKEAEACGENLIKLLGVLLRIEDRDSGSLRSVNMLEIAIELAANDPFYEDMAIKFAEHFIWIAVAMNQMGPDGMWDEEDGFYYDVLRLPDGSARRLKVRSMVGLLPLAATTVIEPWQRERVPRVVKTLQERWERMPALRSSVHATGRGHLGYGDRGIAALVSEDRLRRILTRMLDENEFLSPYGIRALSRYHADHPFIVNVEGQEYRVNYLPAESDTGMFGGNSNWRGPIWMPVNAILIRALMSYYLYYGDNFKIECPTGSGKLMNLFEVSHEIVKRLEGIFLRDKSGRRPVFGGTEKFQTDPLWRDNILFYEYFHGDGRQGDVGRNLAGVPGCHGKGR
jgi:hypothetical protein